MHAPHRAAPDSPPGAPAPDPLGAAPAAFGREARHPLAGRRRVADLVTTIVLLVLETAVAVVAAWGIVFLSLAFHSCAAPGNRCDAALGGAVVYVGPVLVALIVVVSIAVSILRLVRRGLAWPIPLVGVVAVIAVFFAATLLVNSAVTRGI